MTTQFCGEPEQFALNSQRDIYIHASASLFALLLNCSLRLLAAGFLATESSITSCSKLGVQRFGSYFLRGLPYRLILLTASIGYTMLCWEQIGKKFEGELIDMHPEPKEGVAVATVDLDEMKFARGRQVSCLALMSNC